MNNVTFILLISLLFALGNSLKANSSNPPSGYHGESLNCTFCHTGNSVNSGDGGISLSGLPTSYVPGQTYNLALTVSGTNARGYGFQLSPKINGNLGGQLTAVSNDMGIESDSAEHRGPSLTGTWNFEWTAPSTDEGTVTFYASGLATGGNSGNDGDYVYTMSQSLVASSFTHASMDWNASTGGVIFSSPTIGTDGAIYIGSNDNQMHAFNPDGTTKWTFPTGNWVDSTPAVGADGTIYVGSWDNKLYAINPNNGQKIWEYETNSNVIASPAVGADGKIYVGSKDSIFYAFESNGSVAWEYFAGQPITASAALGQDGTIYFGDENGSLHALNSDGSSKWTYQVDNVADSNNSILSSAALDLSGNIYFGSGNGYCYSISDNETNASLNWKFLTGDRVDTSPVLGINDDIFFVSRDGYLRSLSTLSGGVIWDAFVGDVFYSSPVVDENGRTYVIGYTGGGQNHLFAFDANGTKAWDTNETECPFSIGGIVDSSLTLSSNGKLYYGCYDNRMYCVDVGTGPASSDWPMFQRNERRDGSWPSYLLETSVSPVGVASISGAGIYNEGTTASITVSSITEGYSFSHWTGGASGSDNPLNLAINSSTSVTANFSLNQYSLTVSGGTGGSTAGSGTFNHGTDAVITATPQTGYYFSGWTGEGIADATSASTTVSITEARTISASFTPKNFSLIAVVTPNNAGQVTGTGNYQFGEEANLTATSTLSGYSFLSWSGDINSTENPLILNIDSNLSLTANFGLNTYSLEISAGIGGSVSGDGNFTHGTLAAISATPDAGYSFTGWSGSGVTDLNSISTTVLIDQERTVSATFSINQYALNVLAGFGGQVSGDGNFSHGSNASISAIADEGYIFRGWTGAGVNDQNATATTVSMTQNRTVTALFDLKNYFLNLDSNLGGSVFGGGNYNHGEVVTITASPDNGYQLENWNGDIDGNLSSPSRTIIMDSNKSISANFVQVTENNFVLTILSSPLTGGASSGAGSYPANSSVSILAEPQTGYEFLAWSGSGIHDLNSSNTNILLSENRTITANFQKKKYLLQINEVDGGSVSGGGNYEYGTEANISALPNEGYTFSQWVGSGITNPGSANSTISVSGDLNISAVFAIKQHTLNLLVLEGGILSGAGSYDFGTVVEISAIPQPGYAFNGWNGGNFEDPSSPSTTITLTNDINVSADFNRIIYSLTVNSNNGGNVSEGGRYYYGYNASLSALANTGYSFTNWEGSGVANPSIPFTTIRITEDRNVTAIFVINSYQLTILQDQGGTAEGTGLYDWNTEVSISASARNGYKFSHWTGDGIIDPNSSATTLTLLNDTEIKPVFDILTLASDIGDVDEIAPDWFDSSWFGTFFQNVSGWSYHLEFGWIYPSVQNAQSIWFWHVNLGWVWVTKDAFLNNYMWSENTQNWFLWDNSTMPNYRYYDYSTSEWMNWQ